MYSQQADTNDVKRRKRLNDASQEKNLFEVSFNIMQESIMEKFLFRFFSPCNNKTIYSLYLLMRYPSDLDGAADQRKILLSITNDPYYLPKINSRHATDFEQGNKTFIKCHFATSMST